MIVENALEVAVVSGPRRTGSFSALKESARNLILAPSVIRKLLFTEKSQRRCESNRTFENRSGKVRTLDAGVNAVAVAAVAEDTPIEPVVRVALVVRAAPVWWSRR